jgi:uncharacterized membrane protein
MTTAKRRLLPRHARNRLLLASVVGGIVVLALSREGPALRTLAGWNAAALAMLSLVWSLIWRADAEETRRRAAADDPGRTAVWFFALAASSVSLFAAIVVLKQAHTLAPGRAVLWVVMCLLAVGTSWLLTHTSWALRYAHLYYRDDAEGVGGLAFPGDRPPTAFDFAYFAFTLGICFQTSDVCITSPQIRRAVLFHACQAFAYNTAILALALNLAFGFVT